jgi:hypothetical protein
MRFSRLIAAAALSLVIAGAAVPASAVPADKGAASKDCRGADVRGVRVDQALCAQRTTIERPDIVPREQSGSAAARGFNVQWLALAALAGVVFAVAGRRRPSGELQRSVRRAGP